MTITFAPGNGQDHWGPGVFFTFSSDIGAPAGAPFTITVQMWRRGTETLIWNYILPLQNNIQGGLKLGYGTDLVPLSFQADATPVNNDAIAVEITARSDSGAIVDSGEKTLPWSETTQLHNELQALAGGGGGGGFTSTDRAALNATQDNTEGLLAHWAEYISVTLPSLDEVLQVIKSNTESTFRSLLGTQIVPLGSLFNVITEDQFLEASISNGVTCDRIDVDVSFSGLTGVNLRIDSYPEGWVFRTPDAAWSFRDLAVLSFWRSGGLVGRHGIHALTHSVSPLPESVAVSFFTTVGYLQPGEYHITVDWAPGVCGELTGSIHP